MKKILTFLVLVTLCSSVFAVDTIRVIRSGKLIKTSSPILSTVTITTINYTTVGTVTANEFTDGTAKLTGGVASGLTTLTATNGIFSTIRLNIAPQSTAITSNRNVTVNINGTNYHMLLRTIP
jgi:hypothetical protein